MPKEHVILCYNEDDEIVAVARPDDPLNPQISRDLIMSHEPLACEVMLVNSVQEILEWSASC